MSDEIKFG